MDRAVILLIAAIAWLALAWHVVPVLEPLPNDVLIPWDGGTVYYRYVEGSAEPEGWWPW